MQESVKARVRDKAVDMETEKVNQSTSIASLCTWTVMNTMQLENYQMCLMYMYSTICPLLFWNHLDKMVKGFLDLCCDFLLMFTIGGFLFL